MTTQLPVIPVKVKTPAFIIGVEEEEGQEKSCEPTRAKVLEAATPPPSTLVKATVRFVQVPFTSTGRLENQNARAFPPLGVGCIPSVKSAVKVPLDPGPVTW